MIDVKSLKPGASIDENLTMARHSANIGDVAHTILHAQEAVCLSVETLAAEINALRAEIKAR
jgi:hypothetical protein